MRVLIVGGNGWMGTRTAARLRESGHDVVVIHRTDCGDPSHVHADRRDARVNGDVAVDMYAMNEDDARDLVNANLAPRLVVISSADIYRNFGGLHGLESAPPDPIPLREDAPLRTKLHPYGGKYEKITVERITRDAGATILRLPAVYGPGDKQQRFAAWLEQLHRGALVLDEGWAQWRWTRGYVDNVADAIALAAEQASPGTTYNVGEPDAPTELEMARTIARLAGLPANVTTARDVPNTPPFDFRFHLVTDTTAIRQDLAYTERIPRNEALRATLRSM